MNKEERKQYLDNENVAYEELMKNGFIPQGWSIRENKIVIFKYEHPEFHNHPSKCGKIDVYYFRNYQEALDELVKKTKKEFRNSCLTNIEKEELEQMKKSLSQFKESWMKCCEIFNGAVFDCNEYILGDEEDNSQYPFNKSFDELNIDSWVNGCIDKIDAELKQLKA